MYVRKVNRQCDVRGCRNKNCYAISQYREFGNSVVICAECMKQTLDIAEKFDFETKLVASTEDIAALPKEQPSATGTDKTTKRAKRRVAESK